MQKGLILLLKFIDNDYLYMHRYFKLHVLYKNCEKDMFQSFLKNR